MRSYLIVSIVLFFTFVATQVTAADKIIAVSIRLLLEKAQQDQNLSIGCEGIHAGADLISFYENRSFIPIWVDRNGPNRLGKEFGNALGAAQTHGLHAEDYHFSCIQAWFDCFRIVLQNAFSIKPKQLAALDIVMTDAFLIFGSHLAAGKVDPEQLYPHWISGKSKKDVFAVLNKMLEDGSVEKALKMLAPSHSVYWRMVNAANQLKKIVNTGGWPILPAGKIWRRGSKDPCISLLRERLNRSGDLNSGTAADKTMFGKNLEMATRRFQRRHGLAADGIVGPITIAALAVPAEDRLQQLLLNLERWRWLPHDWGNRYIIVNTASFSLEAFNGGGKGLVMPVIVGEAYKKTPVFSKKISYLEINPYWNVPRNIAVDELLPIIKKSPGFLTAHHYELVSGWKESSPVLDPDTIEWETVNADNFPGRLRQTPGPWNTLGRIKFMLPNHFQVYLHDTPHRHLFLKNNRALSHGCIRVGRPIELALFVLQDEASWERERIERLIATGKRYVIRPKHPCITHLLYWTSWVNEKGEIQFRKDIYDRDGILWEALNKMPGSNKQLLGTVSHMDKQTWKNPLRSKMLEFQKMSKEGDSS